MIETTRGFSGAVDSLAIIIIIIQHLYSALKSEDAEPLVVSGYDCLNK